MITQYRGTISGGPNFAYELCSNTISESTLAELELSSWRVAFNGAEPISARTIDKFQQRFEQCGFKKKNFYCCYGMAETTLFVTGTHLDTEHTALYIQKNGLSTGTVLLANPPDDGEYITSSGKPNHFEKISIVDPESLAPLPEGTVGEIWVQGKSNASGYWGEEKESLNHATFAANTTTNQGPFLRTGDLGMLYKGYLFVTGRIKDLIIIRGENYYPHSIEEAVAAAHPAIRSGCVVALGLNQQQNEKLVVVAELKPNSKVDMSQVIEQIHHHVGEECDVQLHEIHLVRAHSIHKTSSGKLQRHACKQTLLEGGFNVIHSWYEHPAPAMNEESIDTTTEDNPDVVKHLILWLREYAPKRINAFLMDERRCIPPHIILHFAQKGLFGLQIPNAWGGLSLNYSQSMQVYKQLSAINLSLGIFVGLANANIRPILRYGHPQMRNRFVPILAKGQDLAAFALTEPDAGSDIHQLKTTARATNDGRWLLNGSKCWSGSAAWSGIMIVFAKAYDVQGQPLGLTAFVVPSDLPGVYQGEESITMGLKAMSQNYIHLEDVALTSEHLLGIPGEGVTITEESLMNSRLGIAALCIGAMQRCVQISIQFAQKRTIATGKLVENPVWIKRINEMHYAISACDHLLNTCTRPMDKKIQLPIELALVNKIVSTEFLWKTIDQSMQLLGGRGYMEVNGLAQIMRDARVMRIFEGTTEVLLDYLGAIILDEPARLSVLFDFLITPPVIRDEFRLLIQDIGIWKEQADSQGTIILLRQQMGALICSIITYAASSSSEDKAYTLWLKQDYQQRLHAVSILLQNADEYLSPNNQEEQPYLDSIGWIQSTYPGQIEQNQDPLLADAERNSMSQKTQTKILSTTASRIDEEEKIHLFAWIKDWLQQKKHISADDLTPQTVISTLGLDSLQAVHLVGEMEQYLQQSLPVDLVYECRTLDELMVSALHKKNQNFAQNTDFIVNDVPVQLEIRPTWLSAFLEYGYKEEYVHFTSITIRAEKVSAFLQVPEYFMPSDKLFHLNIFNCKVSLVHLMTVYLFQLGLGEQAAKLQLMSLEQRYNRPIRNATDILFNLSISMPVWKNEGLVYTVDFSVMEGCFQGKAQFYLPCEAQREPAPIQLSEIQLDAGAIKQMIPSWLNNPYNATHYEIEHAVVSKQGIIAEVRTLSDATQLPHQKMTHVILSSIYTAQLGVVFACWDNELTEKHGEFYLMKHHEYITDAYHVPANGVQKIHMQLKNKVCNFNRIVYTMEFTIEQCMQGEVAFAIPMVQRG